MKIQKATKRETVHIALGVLALAGVENGVFALLHRWDWTVLAGSAMGSLAAVANFFLLALTVQKAVAESETRAKQWMQMSHSLRMLLMAGVMVGAFLAPWANGVAAVLCLLFPQVTILVMRAMGKYRPDSPDQEEG